MATTNPTTNVHEDFARARKVTAIVAAILAAAPRVSAERIALALETWDLTERNAAATKAGARGWKSLEKSATTWSLVVAAIRGGNGKEPSAPEADRVAYRLPSGERVMLASDLVRGGDCAVPFQLASGRVVDAVREDLVAS